MQFSTLLHPSIHCRIVWLSLVHMGSVFDYRTEPMCRRKFYPCAFSYLRAIFSSQILFYSSSAAFQCVGEYRKQRYSYRGCGFVTPLQYLAFRAHLPNINSTGQRSIADKTQGKSYLCANRARTCLFDRKLGLCTSPKIFFSFASDRKCRKYLFSLSVEVELSSFN